MAPRSAAPGRDVAPDGPAVPPVVAAAVDAGSNSVHLLVGTVRGHRIEPLVDESVFLGLGAAADERGYLGEGLSDELTAALAEYAERARRLGATRIAFVGTEPLRRAADAARLAQAVWRRSHVPLHVVTHDEEAQLTLLGVTAGRPLRGELVVVDVGGGSSEFVVAAPGRPPVAVGLPVGSARLTARHVRNDPPSRAEIATMTAAAQGVLADAPDARPDEVVVVGGTAANLVRMASGGQVDGVLTREQVLKALSALGAEPAYAVAARFGLRPERSRVLPAGAAIVAAILERYEITRVRVTDTGVREGTILALGRAGASWRDSLATLAQGWRR